jgi:hypothetical protein
MNRGTPSSRGHAAPRPAGSPKRLDFSRLCDTTCDMIDSQNDLAKHLADNLLNAFMQSTPASKKRMRYEDDEDDEQVRGSLFV